MDFGPILIFVLVAAAAAGYYFLYEKRKKSPMTPVTPPAPGGKVSMNPNLWSFQASPGMPVSPTPHPDGWAFDFPARDGVHYLVHAVTAPLSGNIRIKGYIEADPTTEFRESDPCTDPHNAAFRPYIERAGDRGTAEYQNYRWWGAPTKLEAGAFDLTFPLAPDAWTQVFAKRGSEMPGEFQATLTQPMAVGVTFGGCFAGHGVYVRNGKARMVIQSFTIG